MIRMSNPHMLKRPRRSDDEDDEDDAEVNMDFGVDNDDFQDMDRMVEEVNFIEEEERKLHAQKKQKRSKRTISDPNEYDALCKVAPMLGGEGPRVTSDENVLFRDHNGNNGQPFRAMAMRFAFYPSAPDTYNFIETWEDYCEARADDWIELANMISNDNDSEFIWKFPCSSDFMTAERIEKVHRLREGTDRPSRPLTQSMAVSKFISEAFETNQYDEEERIPALRKLMLQFQCCRKICPPQTGNVLMEVESADAGALAPVPRVTSVEALNAPPPARGFTCPIDQYIEAYFPDDEVEVDKCMPVPGHPCCLHKATFKGDEGGFCYVPACFVALRHVKIMMRKEEFNLKVFTNLLDVKIGVENAFKVIGDHDIAQVRKAFTFKQLALDILASLFTAFRNHKKLKKQKKYLCMIESNIYRTELAINNAIQILSSPAARAEHKAMLDKYVPAFNNSRFNRYSHMLAFDGIVTIISKKAFLQDRRQDVLDALVAIDFLKDSIAVISCDSVTGENVGVWNGNCWRVNKQDLQTFVSGALVNLYVTLYNEVSNDLYSKMEELELLNVEKRQLTRNAKKNSSEDDAAVTLENTAGTPSDGAQFMEDEAEVDEAPELNGEKNDENLRQVNDAIKDVKSQIFRLKESRASVTARIKRCSSRGGAEIVVRHLNSLLLASYTQNGGGERDPTLAAEKLAVLNGVINLRTGKLEMGVPSDFIYQVAPVVWVDMMDPIIRFDRAISEIMLNGDEKVHHLQILYGMGIIGDVRIHKAIVQYGRTGRNGKGLLSEFFSRILGDYALTCSSDVLSKKQASNGANEALMSFVGKRLIFSTEWNSAITDIENMKRLTGGDPIRTRGNYRSEITIVPSWTLSLSTNCDIKFDNTDLAMWSRLCLVPFTATFVPEGSNRYKKVPNHKKFDLDESLGPTLAAAELSSGLAWLVRGSVQYLADPALVTTSVPPEFDKELDAFQNSSHKLADFVEECIQVCPISEITQAELIQVYQSYHKAQNGLEITRAGEKNLRDLMREYLPSDLQVKRSGSTYIFKGIRLTECGKARLPGHTEKAAICAVDSCSHAGVNKILDDFYCGNHSKKCVGCDGYLLICGGDTMCMDCAAAGNMALDD